MVFFYCFTAFILFSFSRLKLFSVAYYDIKIVDKVKD